MATLAANVTVSGNLFLATQTFTATTSNIAKGFSIGPILGTSGTPNYLKANCISLVLTTPSYQLDMSTDLARKLTTTTWTTGSDERIKKNIQSANLERCVDIVQSLDLKYFEWDSKVNTSDKRSLGWIAQEVQQYFPNSVRTSNAYGLDDFHDLNSDQLIKVMYGALKKMIQDSQ